MPETLKPCPFCGGIESLRFAGLNLNSGGGYRNVYCDPEKGGCGVQARSAQYTSMRTTPYVSERQAEDEAARLWNARQPDTEQAISIQDHARIVARLTARAETTEHAIADWLEGGGNRNLSPWVRKMLTNDIRSGKWREGGG